MNTQDRDGVRDGLKFSAMWLIVVFIVLTWAIHQRRRSMENQRALDNARLELERIRVEQQPQLVATPGNAVSRELQAENVRLRQRIDESQRSAATEDSALADENVKLKKTLADLNESRAREASGPPTSLQQTQPEIQLADDTVPRDKFEAHLCYAHLKQINLAATWWAQEHAGMAPTNIFQLQELLAPITFVCPSAKPRSVATRWEKFDPSTVTYQLRWWTFRHRDNVPMWRPHGPHWLFASCPIHGIECYNEANRLSMPLRYFP